MAANFRTFLLFCVWFTCCVWVCQSWDLLPLKPKSCPDDSEDEGICYKMTEKQVRCFNVTIGPCAELKPTEGKVRTYLGWNGMCLQISAGYCSLFSCGRVCCEDYYTEDYGECDSPYCSKHCENGGTCLRRKDSDEIIEKCECPSPFYGETCEKAKCSDECENGGTCIVDGARTVCACAEGFYGKTCSSREIDFPVSCPRPNKTEWDCPNNNCGDECWLNADCGEGRLCCNDGCCSTCISPVDCRYHGNTYRPGDDFKDGCKECRCLATGIVCTEASCPNVRCRHGRRPVVKPDQCCPVCPDDGVYLAPKFSNCRQGMVRRLSVLKYTSIAYLTQLDIKAHDRNGRSLHVTYSEDYIKHCKCTYSCRNKHVVVATARDYHGHTSTCEFFVIVSDPYPPVYNSCPADIFAVKGETIEWNEPRANDYVGIQSQSCDTRNGQSLSVGDHRVTCTAIDFDSNKAFCQFTVYVYEESDAGGLPLGLESRQKKEVSLVYILVSTFSALCLILILIFAACFIRRNRNLQQRRRHQARAGNHGNLAVLTISNGNYSEEFDKSALPPYSLPNYDPPTYDDIRNDEDQQPPTYEQSSAHVSAQPDGSGRGYLNSAYDSSTVFSTGGQTVPEEEIYEEIRLN